MVAGKPDAAGVASPDVDLAVDASISALPEAGPFESGSPGFDGSPSGFDTAPSEVAGMLDGAIDGAAPEGCRDQGLVWDENPVMGQAESVAFSPDGQFLAATIQRAGLVWRISDGAMVHGFTDPCVIGGMSSVSYFPDGRSLAAASCGATFTIWTDGDFAGRLNDVGLYAISPDGLAVATAASTEVRLVEIATDETLATFREHTGTVSSLAFSPDGATLASGGTDATIRLWNVSTGGQKAALVTGAPVSHGGVAISPDGKLVAALSAAGLELWSLADQQLVGTMAVDPLAESFGFTRDSQFIVAGGATVGVYSVAGLQLVYQMGERAYAIAVSPDGMRVAATGDALKPVYVYCLRQTAGG